MKAAQRFDETRGFKFISYAVWWIRQAILQALAEQSRIVRLPVNKIGSINRINRTFSRLEQLYEREPSTQEIAEMLEMIPEIRLFEMRGNRSQPIRSLGMSRTGIVVEKMFVVNKTRSRHH